MSEDKDLTEEELDECVVEDMSAIASMITKATEYNLLTEVVYSYGEARTALRGVSVATMTALSEWDLL